MKNGFLQAVVKYNLNFCYTADLTGQFGPGEFPEFPGSAQMNTVSTHSGCNGVNYLLNLPGNNSGSIAAPTLEELVEFENRVAISKRVPIGLGHELQSVPKADYLPVEFDFREDPIPVNARDITLQIIYRGELGSGNHVEDDSVVVKTFDIPEPTYITFTNSLDYTYINGHFLAHEAAVSALEGIVSELRKTGDEEDEARADHLEDSIDTLIDPSVPIKDFTCEDEFGNPGFVTFESLEVKRYVRLVALPNTVDTTLLDLCRYTVTRLNSNESRRLAVYVAASVADDFYDRSEELFMLEGFPKLRGVVQKQGSSEYYDGIGGWSALYNHFLILEDLFPAREPTQKVQNISVPIEPEPVPISIRCDYTWDECNTEAG